MTEISKITGLENPNSVMQMRAWHKEEGIETECFDKKAVSDLLTKVNEKAACIDDRCRGMFQFLGANRTGKWSGRLIQL